MESCFGTLKTELVHLACYPTRPARVVRLHRRILQSSAASFRSRVYHPRTGRAPSRLIQCPPNRGKVTFRKKVYRFIDELQADLDVWIHEYNEARPHQGRWCFGKTPMQTFLDAMPMTKEKMIAA